MGEGGAEAVTALANDDVRLNAICPYFTMFPLSFPLAVIARASRKNEVVFDPFCGRGTTSFAARVLGASTVAIDANPIAVAATSAKLVGAVTPNEIVGEAEAILRMPFEGDLPQGQFWRITYRKKVLTDLCALRSELLKDCRSDARKALCGILLGALHGPLRKNGSSSYLSNQSPRTYAPKPRYAVAFWKRYGFRAPSVSSLDVISERAKRFYERLPLKVSHRVRCGDARSYSFMRSACGREKPTLIITSPPYYGLRTYVADQWIRNWFLGGLDRVDYSYGCQLSHRGVASFISDLRTVWQNTARVSDTRARLVFRFGAINDRRVDPRDIILRSLEDTPWRLKTIVAAGTARFGKRQSEAFVLRSRAPIVELDAWAERQ
jgi:DNA methylase